MFECRACVPVPDGKGATRKNQPAVVFRTGGGLSNG